MKRILIVDNAMTVRMYHRQLMEAMSFHVDEAENGVEALEKCTAVSYDLLLVDVNMPIMDGYRFVAEIRQNENLMAIPVVMISTEEEQEDKDKAFMAGANFYFVKPLQPSEFKECVAVLLGECS
jgi:two-component system chemotaxis response regulator CheY